MSRNSSSTSKFIADRYTPKQGRAKERIRQIIAASAYEFQERGIEQTTTNHIAARAELPVGSIYKYFTDKEAIINALLEVYKQDMVGLVSEVAQSPFIPGATLLLRLESLLYEFADYCQTNQPLIVISFAQSDPRFKTKVTDLQSQIALSLTAMLQATKANDAPIKAITIMQYILNYCDLAHQHSAEAVLAQQNVRKALKHLLES